MYKMSSFSTYHKEHAGKEIPKTIPFTIARVNLTKGVKDLYNENYKTLKKEIRKTLAD
jgi:hypothetical protein